MTENILFEYLLNDAYSIKILSLKIFDRDIDNVVCEHKNESDIYTISLDALTKIKDIISENTNVAKIKDVEFAPILDGVKNYFEIFYENKNSSISCSNLWWFLYNENIEDYRNYNGKNPKNAELIIEFFEEIRNVLIENKVDEKYMSLDN